MVQEVGRGRYGDSYGMVDELGELREEVRKADSHLWSEEIEIEVEEVGSRRGGRKVEGRFCPHLHEIGDQTGLQGGLEEVSYGAVLLGEVEEFL